MSQILKETLQKIARGEVDNLSANPADWSSTLAKRALGVKWVDGKEVPNSLYATPKPNFGRVKPAEGEDYYFIGDRFTGVISCAVWQNDHIDNDRWSMGNVYLTREVVELARDRQLAKIRVIDKLAELRTVELDWQNIKQDKFYLVLHSNTNTIDYFWSDVVSATDLELHSTENAVKWVAENMADDVRLVLTGE